MTYRSASNSKSVCNVPIADIKKRGIGHTTMRIPEKIGVEKRARVLVETFLFFSRDKTTTEQCRRSNHLRF
jgi:hypothetical protein